MDNQNPLGITEHGTSVSICPQTQAERYRDAYRELFWHFLRALKGGTRLKLMAGVALVWLCEGMHCVRSGRLGGGRNESWEGKLPWILLSFVKKAAACDSQEILSQSPGCPEGIKITESWSGLGRKRL